MSAPELGLAARHDAAGRHDEAINALSRGAMAGDLACRTQLGLRLLSGDRAPLLAAEGARLLQEAADAGGGEAAARIAALTALGLYCRQSWPEALRWLVTAAQRHWQPAQAQLLALAGESARPAGSAAAQDWPQFAARIDFSAWQQPAAVRDLCAAPLVRVLDRFMPPAVCGWFIARSRGRLTRALVYDPANRQDVARATRTNSVANFNLGSIELLDVLVQARMSDACGIPVNHFEAPAVLNYTPGEEAVDHYDFVHPDTPDYAQEIARNGQRILTFLVYLNDDYQGGETRFPLLGVAHKGRSGEGLLFSNVTPGLAPEMRMLHAGCAPAQGEKWIISQFIRGRPTLVPVPPRQQYRARPA